MSTTSQENSSPVTTLFSVHDRYGAFTHVFFTEASCRKFCRDNADAGYGAMKVYFESKAAMLRYIDAKRRNHVAIMDDDA